MRKSLFFLALFLVGCGDNNQSLVAANARLPAEHVPEITQLTMSPESAEYMEGGGDITVSVEVTFADEGSDLRNLWVKTSDEDMQFFDEAHGTAAGTFTEEFSLSTEYIGIFEIEFWLMDEAGDASNRIVMDFLVGPDPEQSDWTNRAVGLPVLRDVTWDGTVFIAVGDDGTILTSVDGIEWATKNAGVDTGLYAIASYEADIFAVGSGVVLQSTDHGENWVAKDIPIDVNLMAVTVNATRVVAGGSGAETFDPYVIVSNDRGDTWEVVDTFPADTINFTDFGYRGDLFIATTDSWFGFNGGRILVSLDGLEWIEVFHDASAGLGTLVQAGNQLIVGGFYATVLESLDGLNWTEKQTPDVAVEYASSAWSGSEIMLAGSFSWEFWFYGGGPPEYYVPAGLSSIDAGATWEVFYIYGHYMSFGLAYGNGRFVSVGMLPEEDPVGAIFTRE